MTPTKKDFKEVHEKLIAAMAMLADEYDLELTLGNMSYNPQTAQFSLPLRGHLKKFVAKRVILQDTIDNGFLQAGDEVWYQPDKEDPTFFKMVVLDNRRSIYRVKYIGYEDTLRVRHNGSLSPLKPELPKGCVQSKEQLDLLK